MGEMQNVANRDALRAVGSLTEVLRRRLAAQERFRFAEDHFAHQQVVPALAVVERRCFRSRRLRSDLAQVADGGCQRLPCGLWLSRAVQTHRAE